MASLLCEYLHHTILFFAHHSLFHIFQLTLFTMKKSNNLYFIHHEFHIKLWSKFSLDFHILIGEIHQKLSEPMAILQICEAGYYIYCPEEEPTLPHSFAVLQCALRQKCFLIFSEKVGN